MSIRNIKEWFTILLVSTLICLLLTGIFFLITFQARMEAKAFNKFSKTKITWWEAVWADYRILPDK